MKKFVLREGLVDLLGRVDANFVLWGSSQVVRAARHALTVLQVNTLIVLVLQPAVPVLLVLIQWNHVCVPIVLWASTQLECRWHVLTVLRASTLIVWVLQPAVNVQLTLLVSQDHLRAPTSALLGPILTEGLCAIRVPLEGGLA